MCGIAGWVDWEQDLTQQGPIVQHMADTLCHRGPDAEGSWLAPHAALVHRRLIVIDPQGGTQPMVHQQGNQTYAITYNGEIYNFRELRSELETRGHTFRTRSDTEVLLHTYLEWGIDCVQHLNGIFAFGLWDEQQQRLLLARDHLGVKPLFYARRGSSIIFGSELKALLAHPAVKPEVDIHGLTELFGFRRAPGSAVFRDVHELRPGHLVVCTHQQLQVKRYWALQSAPHTDDLVTTTEHVRALLEDTVRRQLISDMPLVAMLSGGLDSSALTALAAREFKQEGKQLHTYSIDFAESAEHFQGNALRPSLDAPWVKRVSEYVGSQHHTLVVDTPELIDNLLVPLRAHDLPAIGQIETSLYLLFKTMKQDATVAISGESADEVFGGYPWFHNEEVIKAPTFPWIAISGMDVSRRQRQALSTWLAPELQSKIDFAGHIQQLYQDSLAEVPRLPGEDAREARMREIFYLNLTHFLPMLLDRKDRMSMAVGFEVRVPFCDHRLVEYVWNIPWEMKNTGGIEKGILREAMTGILPDDARKRRKSAYPSTQNPTYVEALRKYTLQILANPQAPALKLTNPEFLRMLVEKKVQLPDEASVFFFERVIQLNTWFQEYHVSIVE
ncbi:asparagine synthase (glutamine-hydrolyzing) [Ktedonosporobacter rubrisoli]|uniref:asparagine synthase (glutamine-hydrolyzing) n=1 Tax=Ktedonosporobacter rubrisoli TaxID=2509675 RepID=A0A4P6JXH4_KTERU|nr:asparagine synthase (glutamine-hydrolyzing) [Ktedonosporobacter rubrisoli]QBD79726.1 asparagine synthase (glutamine-hydrolyzing) [Ktedonosporobacter rubrisoli]